MKPNELLRRPNGRSEVAMAETAKYVTISTNGATMVGTVGTEGTGRRTAPFGHCRSCLPPSKRMIELNVILTLKGWGSGISAYSAYSAQRPPCCGAESNPKRTAVSKLQRGDHDHGQHLSSATEM
jgi:hypothetical protein